ncbi:hypothetical protein DVK44_16575 [Streptomyces paludis]|uniref:Uncharacterized protein n=1 Tax=Streptomyces paludis TaxID=2282738 RepID=A0A345HQR5_9ACTN|nr:hypothetical protein DVK44_16575 [Streptomyces paludis]
MHRDFRTRVLLMVSGGFLSLTASLTAALLAYITGGGGLQALSWGAGTFVGSMTLVLGALTILLF